MKFKALLSPKQFISYKGQKLQASEGLLITDDKEIIELLKGNSAWECLTKEVKKELPKEIKKEEPKKTIKKGIKK